MSTNSVALEVGTSSLNAEIIYAPKWRPREARAARVPRARRRPGRRYARRLRRRPPGARCRVCRPAGATLSPGRGHPEEAGADPVPFCRDPAAPPRTPPELPPEPPPDAPDGGRRRRHRSSRRPTPTRAPQGSHPPHRPVQRRSRFGPHRFQQAAGKLAECGEGTHARVVVSRHDVVEAEAENRVQDQGHEHLATYQEPNATVGFESVDLLLDHLAVAGEELGKVRLQALGPRCLDEQVKGCKLHVPELAKGVPDRLDSQLQGLERVVETVARRAELLDRACCQVAPGFDQKLRLGREVVLQVADRHTGAGRNRANASSGVAVFQQRLRGGTHDLLAGARGACGYEAAGHTYV